MRAGFVFDNFSTGGYSSSLKLARIEVQKNWLTSSGDVTL